MAILGALAGGAYDDVETAVSTMTPSPSRVVEPNPDHLETYSKLYTEYLRLVDFFGRDADSPLKRLRELRP